MNISITTDSMDIGGVWCIMSGVGGNYIGLQAGIPDCTVCI